MMLIGSYRAYCPIIKTLDLTVSNKPAQGKFVKICAASDLHLGITLDKKRLKKWVDLINKQSCDIVLLVGDVRCNAAYPVVKQKMYEELNMINVPVFCVSGNHEFSESADPYQFEKYVHQFTSITYLRDSFSLFDNSFYIVGREDNSQNRRKLSGLLLDLDESKPIILLDHQPVNLEEAEAAGVSLQISGHTHDGQFFPIELIVRMIYENAYGYSKRGSTQYYVTSGLGFWGPPFRTFSRSEIVVINLSY